MKIIYDSKIIFLFLASFIFLNACNPNISETTIYTSDFEEVKNAEHGTFRPIKQHDLGHCLA